jgi:hypothetical protein
LDIRCKTAVDLFFKNLGFLPHPSGLVRLVQFSHDSPGLRVYKRQVAEALVMLLENQGLLIFNDEDEAIGYLEANGYRVSPLECCASEPAL